MTNATSESIALALQALSRKERTVAELGEWLRARGVDEAEREAVIAELVELGSLDDERFAREFAADKRELAGWGSQRIAATLRERGVGEAEIEAALALEEPGVELERAVGLLRSRGLRLDDDGGRNAGLGLLIRRGFDLETAYEAIRLAPGGS